MPLAETSVTIADVVYVVDSGKLKERRHNAARGMSLLVEDFVSQVRSRVRIKIKSGQWLPCRGSAIDSILADCHSRGTLHALGFCHSSSGCMVRGPRAICGPAQASAQMSG